MEYVGDGSGGQPKGSPDNGSPTSSSRMRVVGRFQPHRLMDRSGKSGTKTEAISLKQSVKASSSRGKLARQPTLANASVEQLIEQGFTAAQANGVIMGRTQASSDPQRGFNKDMTQLAELKRVGFSLQELRDVGFSPAVLRTAGYSMQEVSARVNNLPPRIAFLSCA